MGVACGGGAAAERADVRGARGQAGGRSAALSGAAQLPPCARALCAPAQAAGTASLQPKPSRVRVRERTLALVAVVFFNEVACTGGGVDAPCSGLSRVCRAREKGRREPARAAVASACLPSSRWGSSWPGSSSRPWAPPRRPWGRRPSWPWARPSAAQGGAGSGRRGGGGAQTAAGERQRARTAGVLCPRYLERGCQHRHGRSIRRFQPLPAPQHLEGALLHLSCCSCRCLDSRGAPAHWLRPSLRLLWPVRVGSHSGSQALLRQGEQRGHAPWQRVPSPLER